MPPSPATLGTVTKTTSKGPIILTPSQAADALREGRVVVAPTESLYGLAADGSSEAALASLWAIGQGESSRQPLAWHIGSVPTLNEVLTGIDHTLSPAQNRLLQRLCPGPLLIALELPPEKLANLRKRIGVGERVIDDGNVALVRIIDNPQSVQAIQASKCPIVMRSIPGVTMPRSFDEAVRAIDRAGGSDLVAGVIDSESRPMGQSSTLVRFLHSGGYRVDREGAYAARYIDKQLMRTILFVCTGNTCRSPMAEAIARGMIERDPLDLPTQVRSAGAFTSGGMPATPEAVTAVESLGFAMPSHSSTVLTRELITQADEIYGLTASHVEAIRSIDASAASKVQLLDPAGQDVPDPIGQDQSVYNQTAEHLLKLIGRRLAEHQTASKQESSR